jgi:hypothetical protein
MHLPGLTLEVVNLRSMLILFWRKRRTHFHLVRALRLNGPLTLPTKESGERRELVLSHCGLLSVIIVITATYLIPTI